MKSLLIMMAGLGIAAWGAWSVRDHMDMGEGFADAKIYYLIGGVVFLVGAVVNHWEHTRKRAE